MEVQLLNSSTLCDESGCDGPFHVTNHATVIGRFPEMPLFFHQKDLVKPFLLPFSLSLDIQQGSMLVTFAIVQPSTEGVCSLSFSRKANFSSQPLHSLTHSCRRRLKDVRGRQSILLLIVLYGETALTVIGAHAVGPNSG